MDGNPFAPPRTTDLDGGAAPAGMLREVPRAALDELRRATPWARWGFRIAVLQLVIGLVNAVLALRGFDDRYRTAGALGALLFTTPLGILFLVFIGRYARQLEALSRGTHGALEGVLGAQRSILRLSGGLTIAAVVLFVLAMVFGVVVAVVGRRGVP